MAHTEIILTANIPSLGAEADIVKVRRGYARNFLLPHGKGLEVTASSLRQINHLKAKRAEREGREVTAAGELASKINKLKVTFELETGESGKAFGSVTAKDIHDRIVKELKLDELPKHAVVLERAIKESGEHDVSVKLHPDVTATLHIKVAAPEPVKPKDTDSDDDADGDRKFRRRTTSRS